MLNDTNSYHKHSSCGFGEQAVAYLYDEATLHERNLFETHLVNCPSCADEIAAFGSVRSSIADWREEFSVMPMPVIEIPELKQPLSSFNQTVSSAKNPRFAAFRNLFSLSPLWKTATAAFAALFICVGAALFIFLLSGKPELAANATRSVEIPVLQANQVENKQGTNEKIPDLSESIPLSPNTELTASPQNDTMKNKNAQVKSVARTSGSQRPKSTVPKTSISPGRVEININNEKLAVNQKRQVPKLSDLKDDEEDKKSLRLADLFDEIGSK